MGTSERTSFLYIRKLATGTVYYCRFRNADGTWATGRNTGTADRREAARWARRELEREPEADIPSFRNYAQRFWKADSLFARSRRARGFSLGNNHLLSREATTRDYCVLSSRIPGFYRDSFPEITAGNSRVFPSPSTV